MEQLFSGMEPPKRSKEEKLKSLQAIQHGLTVKKKKFNWPYYSVLTAAVAVLFILIASLQTSTPSSVHSSTVAAPEIKNIYMFIEQTDLYDEPRTFMSKWYNLDKITLKESEIKMLTPILNRQTFIDGPIETTINTKYYAMIVQYDDGVEHYFAIDFNQLINKTTNSVSELSLEEERLLSKFENRLYKQIPSILKLVILFGAYSAYMTLLTQLSPIRKLILEQSDTSLWKQFRYGIVAYFSMMIVLGISKFLYGADNILFISSFFALFFIIKLFIQRILKGQPYSYWEIPLSTFAFTCFTVIFTL